MSDFTLFAVILVLATLGSSLITYFVDRKFVKERKKSVRITVDILTFVACEVLFAMALLMATLVAFGR